MCLHSTEKESGWLCGTGSLRMRPKTGLYIGEYLVSILLSKSVSYYLTQKSVGTTMDNLNTSILAALKIPCPPLEEQAAIISFIHEDTLLPMNSALEAARREIDLIREYRTRLIADVVTGKIDVREAAQHLPAEDVLPEMLGEVEALAEEDEDVETENETVIAED